jgi:hypothetical protein
MHKERLQQMVTMLRNLPPEGGIGFSLANWYDPEHPCGTVACAIGHACLNPVFTEQGLQLDRGAIFENPRFAGVHGWEAVEKFFDLSADDAKRFFFEDSYPHGDTTANEVADRIESFLKEAEVTA